MTFEEDLAELENAPTKTADVQILVGKTLTTFRFYQWSGIQWAEEADNHPIRPGVIIDANYGYNLRSLCRAAAKETGRRVDDDGAEHTLDPEQWDKLFRHEAGAPVQDLCDAIWRLNEGGPAAEIDAARKASAAASVRI
jgi:hypothetical protein